MSYDRSFLAIGLRAALVLVAASSLGCFAYSKGEIDWDDHPVVDTGVGATIIYPGQTAPTYYPNSGNTAPAPGPPVQAAPGSAPAPGTQRQAPPGVSATQPSGAPSSYGSAPTHTSGPNGEQTTGAPESSGAPITMIGGAEKDEKGHLAWKQEPLWWKYLALPFAAIAAPFKAAADVARGEPEPGPEVPQSTPETGGTGATVSAPPPPAPVDYETAMVNQLERELDDRNRRTPSRTAAAPPETSDRHGSAGAAPLSIAAELAALQRTPDNAPRPRPVAPENATAPPPHTGNARPAAAADGIVDRDGDGRVDQWIYRENGEIARIELDENADGRPDRTLHYDLASHEIRRVEEDTDGDGNADSWTDYGNGRVLRRRGDSNRDGTVDTWSFYREGEITRHEQDTTGNGFRDRVGYYEDGKLKREEHDSDGDGRADATIHYDARERVLRREEDTDSDGRLDVISHYEAGRLARRELLAPDDLSDTARP
jgi:hypothetical protein